jgi:hypothetical protein
MYVVIDLHNNKGLTPVGEFRLEKDGSVGNIWERYVFEWESKGIEKDRRYKYKLN